MSTEADEIIRQLGLEPHVEGGFYAQSFVSEQNYNGRRLLWTSIYFMLCTGEVSYFHRLIADELWYFHSGEPLTIHMIFPDGRYSSAQLGMNLEMGERPQVLVPAGTIFGSEMCGETYSLVGCMVSSGFTFEDFELFSRESLLQQYPQYDAVIQRLTREF